MKTKSRLLFLVLFSLAAIGRAQTLQDDLWLGGVENRLLDDAVLTLKAGSSVVAESGAAVNLSLATVTFANGQIPQAKIASLVSDLAGKQPLDATLTGLATVTVNTAGQMLYATGTDAFGTIPTTSYGRSVLNVADAATLFGGIKQAATTSVTGVVELATSDETITGTDTNRAVTPAGNKAALDAKVDPVANTRTPRQALVFDGSGFCSVAIPAPASGQFSYSWIASYASGGASPVPFNGDLRPYYSADGSTLYVYDAVAGVSRTIATGLIAFRPYRFTYTRTAAGVWTSYVDGAFAFTGSDSSNYANGVTVVGAENIGLANPFIGRIYDLLPYNYALSADQIAALFRTGGPAAVDRGGGEKVPVVDRDFGDAGRWSVINGSISGNVLTLNTFGSAGLVGAGSFLEKGKTYTLTFTNTDVGKVYYYDGSGFIFAATGAGTFSVTFVAQGSTGWAFGVAGDEIELTSWSLVQHGTTVQYDAQQRGVGPVWHDINGTSSPSHIMLPADGASGGAAWALPGGGETEIGPFDLTPGVLAVLGGADARRVPTGYAVTGVRAYIAAGSTGSFALGDGPSNPSVVNIVEYPTLAEGHQSFAAKQPYIPSPARVWIASDATIAAGSLVWLRIVPIN